MEFQESTYLFCSLGKENNLVWCVGGLFKINVASTNYHERFFEFIRIINFSFN
jgi:hypothetical protein